MSQFRLRTGILRLLIISLLLLLIGRIGYLQIVDGKKLTALAQENWVETKDIQAVRGTIYDSAGQKLAYTLPAFYLNVHPESMKGKDPQYLAQKISDLSNRALPYDALIKIFNQTDSKGWFELPNYKIEQKTKDAIVKFLETHFKEQSASMAEYDSGIYFMDTVKRDYPNGDFASHVLGFVTGNGIDKPLQGAGGIEYQYNSLLTGKPGKERFLKDRDGNPLPFGQQLYKAPVQGKDIVLTIDSTIQRFAEQAVDTIMKKYLPKEATVIVTNPKTGEILALANRPSYDPNDISKASANALYTNWGVNAVFEPGSTFKVVTLTAALAEHKISLNDTYQSGSIMVKGATHPIYDWNYVGWGRITYREAMIHSSNVGFVNIGQALGADLLFKYIDLFGFNHKTGIDLPGEPNSILFDPKTIRPVNLATTSFGQGIAVSSIQQVAAVGAVANGGDLMKPFVMKEVRDPTTGATIQVTKPTVVRQIATPEIMKTVRQVMAEDVNSDEKVIKVPIDYPMAGKTGTAQIPDDHGGYMPNEYVTSFIGFAPVQDPKLEIYVTVRSPDPSKAPAYGDIIAEPSALTVMNESLHYMGVQPQTNTNSMTDSKNQSPQSVANYALVPDLSGQTATGAAATAKKAGFQLQVLGTGKTISKQWPAANQQFVQGSRIIVLTGDSIQPGKEKMPDLTGISLREVSDILSVLHVGFVPSGSGFADRQSIPPGSDLPAGATIQVDFKPR
ncbi:PASTA domain-containing protein [Fodinisporobacter ferrooxydans]|uniref:PASTA domain-containing protein n=1 Tax=Fodinisporobacter ferrooxydans TaxID=2901836 RepID=A0ABY4CF83_9BACL|nr:PASTA domain-containing protein [Alicyclobacillaceae bacterium MYW30-H2]